MLDNLPVDLLTERDEGPVVAVNVGMGGVGPGPARARRGCPPLGETLLRTMMIGSGGAVAAAREQRRLGRVRRPSLGVGLLEFHQLDRMVQAGPGRGPGAARAGPGDLGELGDLPAGHDAGSRPAATATTRAEPLLTAQSSNGHPSTMPGGRPGST